MAQEKIEIQELYEKLFIQHKLKQVCIVCKSLVSGYWCPRNGTHELRLIKKKETKNIVVRLFSVDKDPIKCTQYDRNKCIKPNCPFAHGDLEYHLWSDMKYINDAVCNPRPKPPKPQLAPKMCTNMTQKGRCQYKDNCDYAHSEGEFKKWKEQFDKDSKKYGPKIEKVKDKLFQTHKLQAVCQTCYKDQGILVLKPDSINHCPKHGGEWDPVFIYPALVRPLPSHPILQLCDYGISCQNKEGCTRAHSEFELSVWEDVKEIERAIKQPRKEPPEYRTPQMCKSMEKTGRCDHKITCKFAHSQSELDEWKERIKEIKESVDFSSLKGSETADTLLAVIAKTNDRSLRLVLDLLVAYETEQYNDCIPIQIMDRVSNIVEVSKFINELAICLHNLVFNIPLLKEQFEVDSNEEHQEMDLRKLLDVVRHKSEELFGQSDDLIYTYATLLQGMCHRIAHQCYLITDGDSEVFSPTLVGTEGFVKTLFLYSIDFIEEINEQGLIIPLDTTNLEDIRDEFKPAYIEQGGLEYYY